MYPHSNKYYERAEYDSTDRIKCQYFMTIKVSNDKTMQKWKEAVATGVVTTASLRLVREICSSHLQQAPPGIGLAKLCFEQAHA